MPHARQPDVHQLIHKCNRSVTRKIKRNTLPGFTMSSRTSVQERNPLPPFTIKQYTHFTQSQLQHFQSALFHFLAACTRLYNPLCLLVCWSVLICFFGLRRFFYYCSCPNAWVSHSYHCPCPPAHDYCSRVSGLVNKCKFNTISGAYSNYCSDLLNTLKILSSSIQALQRRKRPNVFFKYSTIEIRQSEIG